MIQKVIQLGPIHDWLPGAMKLSLDLSGDQVVSSQVEFGYLAKDVLSKMKGMHATKAQLYFSRIEPESAFLLDRIYCEAIEKAVAVELSQRALWIRDVTTSIAELDGLLKYLALMAKQLGVKSLEHVILRHREELLDQIELLTGSRYGYFYLQPGGARYDITHGFIERLESWLKSYEKDFPRIEALCLWTHPFHNRLKSLGRVADDGKMGFVSNASVENSQYGLVSHVESRLIFAFKQTLELSELLLELLELRHSDEFQIKTSKEIAALSVINPQVEIELESARGAWGVKLALKNDQTIESIEVSTPSEKICQAIPMALEDERFEDLPLILQSLNFRVTEIDR
jgi:NADH:ubiquinone oxidoreductase subunit D